MNKKSSFYQSSVLYTIVFAVFIVFALLMSFLNWFLFIKEPTLPSVSAPQRSVTFSRAALDEVLFEFENKRAKYNSSRVSLPVIADPSK